MPGIPYLDGSSRLFQPSGVDRTPDRAPPGAAGADRGDRTGAGRAGLARLRPRAIAGRRPGAGRAGPHGEPLRADRATVGGRRRRPGSRHDRQPGLLRGGPAGGGRCRRDGRGAPRRDGGDRLLGASATRSPRDPRAGDGVLPVQQRGDRRAGGAPPGRGRPGADPRLGRPSRERDKRRVPGDRRGLVRVDPRVAPLPGERAGIGPGERGGSRLHGQPAGRPGVGGRRVLLAGRPRRR